MTRIDRNMQVGEALFILGHQDLSDVDALMRDICARAEKWDLLNKIGGAPKGDARIQWHLDMVNLKMKLEAIKDLTAPFVEWGGPYHAFYRVRLHKHPELQEYVSELMKVLYPDKQTSEETQEPT